MIREEEVQFYRTNRFETQEEQRKGEKLLVSAIHALALRYHEEMVGRFDGPRSPTTHEESFYAQEYNNPNP